MLGGQEQPSLGETGAGRELLTVGAEAGALAASRGRGGTRQPGQRPGTLVAGLREDSLAAGPSENTCLVCGGETESGGGTITGLRTLLHLFLSSKGASSEAVFWALKPWDTRRLGPGQAGPLSGPASPRQLPAGAAGEVAALP